MISEHLRLLFWFFAGALLGILIGTTIGCSTEPQRHNYTRRNADIPPPTPDAVEPLPPGNWLSHPRLPQYRMVIQPNGDWTFTVVMPTVARRPQMSHLTCNDTAALITNDLLFNGPSDPADSNATYIGFWNQSDWEWPQYGIVNLKFYPHWWISLCCDSLGNRFPSYDAGPLIRGYYHLTVYGDCNATRRRRVVMWPDSLIPGPPWLLREQLAALLGE